MNSYDHMTPREVLSTTGDKFADTPFAQLADLIGKRVAVSVATGERQTKNVTVHAIGVVSGISFNDHDATGGHPGDGTVQFERSAIHWHRFDQVTIEVI